MNAEKIYTRPNGDKVKIEARLETASFTLYFKWEVKVFTCEKGKRTWFSIINTNDYEYRKISFDARPAFILEKQLSVVTPDEILEVKTMAWEKLKPTL